MGRDMSTDRDRKGQEGAGPKVDRGCRGKSWGGCWDAAVEVGGPKCG